MKKRFVMLGIFVMLAVVLAGCQGTGSVWAASSETNDKIEADSWTFTAKHASGHTAKDFDFSSDQLAVFHIESTCREGEIFLVLTQGDAERAFDISGKFDGFVDTRDFEPGTVRVRLNLEEAYDVRVVLSWGV